jgi:hypothetical protein
MNGAHWHLLVNHFPIIGGLMATIVLGYGLFRHNESVVRLSFGLFVLMAALTMITDQTGESAEHYLKSIHTLDEEIFHEHEEAAGPANLAMYLTGLLSLLALVWQRAKQLHWLPTVIFVVSLIAFGLMANAGRLGGLIMHKELREAPATTSATP